MLFDSILKHFNFPNVSDVSMRPAGKRNNPILLSKYNDMKEILIRFEECEPELHHQKDSIEAWIGLNTKISRPRPDNGL